MIKVARIVNILGNADNGIFEAKHVKLALPDKKYEISAYAKKLSETDFMVELLTALIGREINLPIPEPVIALTATDEIWFASVDAKHPDLSRRLTATGNTIPPTPNNLKILSKLADWQLISEAIGFDEWIANGDRHPGNILYDGNGIYYLIDHNQAMRLPFAPDAPITNQLLNIKLYFTQDEVGKQRLKNKINLLANEIPAQLPRAAADRILETANNLDQTLLNRMVEFLEHRLTFLTTIAYSKISTQQINLCP